MLSLLLCLFCYIPSSHHTFILYSLFAAALQIKCSLCWESNNSSWEIWHACGYLTTPVAKVSGPSLVVRKVGTLYLGYGASLHCNKFFQLYEGGGTARKKILEESRLFAIKTPRKEDRLQHVLSSRFLRVPWHTELKSLRAALRKLKF